MLSFLNPLAALGALIAIPIILLYMLRLRRRELVISSNQLWQQILRDREANTPWQRLKRNLLLILQLIVLTLLVLALMRPAQVVPSISAGKTVVLLDASASMNATDAGGQTRFVAAQERANLLLNDLSADDEMAIIRVADNTAPIINYTGRVNGLRDAIFAAEVGQGRGDWQTALTLAAAGAQGAEQFNIIIISDGGISNAGQLPENITQPVYLPVGTSADNVAITALATRTLPGQNPQLFAQVRNYGAEAVEVALLVRLDGELWESVTQTISAQSARSLTFDVDQPFVTVQAELVLDDDVPDFLALDNRAYTVAQDTSTRRVLLLSNQQNRFLEEGLRSLTGVQIFRGDAARSTLPQTPYDLYVFNDWLPDTLPDADMLIINPPADTDLFTLAAASEGVTNLDIVERAHPLMNFVTLDRVVLNQYRAVSDSGWAQALVTADDMPVVLAGEDRGRRIALMSFDLLDSDLPVYIAWPIFLYNMTEWAAPANVISGGTAFSVGDVVQINPPLDTSAVSVTLPDGSTQSLDLTDQALAFASTQQPGFYTVTLADSDGAINTQVFAVNLFGSGESDITPVPESALQLGGGAALDEAEEQFSLRDLWPELTVLALVILLLEWWLYYRRLRVPAGGEVTLQRTTARQ